MAAEATVRATATHAREFADQGHEADDEEGGAGTMRTDGAGRAAGNEEMGLTRTGGPRLATRRRA